MHRILFVCIENSARSQMAEAFARIHGAGRVEAYSAGSKPSGRLNPKAVAAMRAVGYDLTTHRSKSLHDIPQAGYDYVVGMGCGDACPWIPAAHRVEWDIPDPRDMDEASFARVRDRVEEEVSKLLAGL